MHSFNAAKKIITLKHTLKPILKPILKPTLKALSHLDIQ